MSDQYFIQLNRSIMELYDRGHLMSAGEMAISLNSIATNAHRMVDRRRQAFNFPPPMVNTDNGPVPMPRPDMAVIVNEGIQAATRQVPGSFRPIREFFGGRSLTPPPENVRPVAELRPAAELIRPLRPVKRKILSRAAFAANCAEVCAICLDNHQKGDSLTTCCGHDFGMECYRNWIYSPASNQKCPTCRTVNPKITVYCKRVYRAPAVVHNNVVNVVENNVV